MTKYEIPETPWELIWEQRKLLSKMWNRDRDVWDLKTPIMRVRWDMDYRVDDISTVNSGYGYYAAQERRINDPDFDLRCQLQSVRHEIERLQATKDIGHIVMNIPALDLIHFGTGVLATAFGSKLVMRGNDTQPYFSPAFHTPDEAMKVKKPDLLHDGWCPKVLDRLRFFNEATGGKIILTPCDTAGPWSIATSVWHYEDMLEAIHTAPEAVRYFMNIVTETIVDWYHLQETVIGRWGRTHTSFSYVWMPRGIGIGDDCMVTVSPMIWEEFFMPYNNRLSHEFGNMITYHCCMRYDTHFESLAKTSGFVGFDPTPEHNSFDKMEKVLSERRGIWMRERPPEETTSIRRLKGKVGMLFDIHAKTRSDVVRKARGFLKTARDM